MSRYGPLVLGAALVLIASVVEAHAPARAHGHAHAHAPGLPLRGSARRRVSMRADIGALSQLRGGAREKREKSLEEGRAPAPKPTARSERLAMTAAVIGIVGAWLAVATVYYASHEGWPIAQSFFYAVDTGMSIGFGTVAEQRPSTKVFTILHVLCGASFVGGAIALFADAAISGAAAVTGSECACQSTLIAIDGNRLTLIDIDCH